MFLTKAMLDEIKEGIINAYKSKKNTPRPKISQLMDAEACLNAKKAVELGFADGIFYLENQPTISNPLFFIVRRLRIRLSADYNKEQVVFRSKN